MDTKEKWNLIVKGYKENFNQTENIIQSIWELYCSEIFNYSKLLGEIESKTGKQIGSQTRVIPDIILKRDGKNVFDIELKQYNLCFNQSMEEQLKSYLTLFHLSVGMIVCKSIYLYTYDYTLEKLNYIIIEFKEDNIDGIKLIELLQKDTFNEEKIKKFIKEKCIAKANIENIKNEVNCDLIKKLVTEYLQQKYTQQEIEEGLKNIRFEVKNGGKIDEPNAPSPDPLVGDITKVEAIRLFESRGYSVYKANTFASKNKTADFYWANPKEEYLDKDLSLILNDNIRKIVYLFNIPKKSIQSNELVFRADKPFIIDLKIIYGDINNFEDSRSHYRFCKFLVASISYK